jgi:hypothetical protein
LTTELGVEPEDRTTALYEQIRAGDFTGQTPPGHTAGDLREAAASPRHNLPAQSTLFIGREQEMAALADLCADPACRLITLVGPGGIGKTRLTLQTAADQLSRFAHGVWFIPLAPLASPDLIPSSIAEALTFRPYGAENLRTQLLNFLVDRHLLLVLDNFEHLLDGVDLLPEILEHAPGVRLLVTSRERLRLREEWVFDVRGLLFPRKRPWYHVGRLQCHAAFHPERPPRRIHAH